MSGYKMSVIVPVYNTEQYLNECIQSVLNQTLRETELILVDDGSTDHSYEIMLAYKEKYTNVKVFHQENKKLGAARNLGMKYATGTYIFFLDSDDYIRETALKELFDRAEEYQLDVITFDADTLVEQEGIKGKIASYDRSGLSIDVRQVYQGTDFLNRFFWCKGAYVSACLSCYRAAFLAENQILFTEQVYYEDNEFALKVLSRAQRMMYLPEMFYVRRYREHSIMTSECGIAHLHSTLKMNEACLKILLKWPNYETIQGPRGVIAVLAGRLLDQLQKYHENKAQLRNHSYLYEFYSFFSGCDKKALLSYLGLELAFAYYDFFSQVTEEGYMDGWVDDICAFCGWLDILKGQIRKTLDRLLAQWQITDQNGKIVIYGTGDIAGRMIHCYHSVYGDCQRFTDRVIFANTKVRSGEKYLNQYPVVPIDTIGKYPISVIIVASTNYERDMCGNLREYYGDRYSCITYREMANYSVII